MVVDFDVPLAEDAKVIGLVFEQDALWFKRPKGETWHLTRPGKLRSWCGLDLGNKDASRSVHVTWPWQPFSCWSCMDRRWARGVR